MGVSVFGGNVEGKGTWVLNDLITEFYEDTCTFRIGLFQQNWVQCWIKLLTNILQQHWLAKLNRIL